MTTSAALADTRYIQVQAISRSVVQAVQALWVDVTPDRILSAMQGETGKQILQAVVAGQMTAAQGAQAFVTGAMIAQGAGLEQVGRVLPYSLAGYAADGRALSTLMYLPALTTATALQRGMDPSGAMLRGLSQLAMLVGSTIVDTARTATQVAMTAEPRCVVYARVVKLPACARCIILAGQQYSYSTGFQRHPKCDCGMEPLAREKWRDAKTPEDLIKEMSPEERRKRFGPAGADAIDQGADIGQVVNARRGMSTTTSGKRVTNEGTTRRGIGGKALNSGFEKVRGKRYTRARESRLMPEQILKQAHGDRELQCALLRKHGYIT